MTIEDLKMDIVTIPEQVAFDVSERIPATEIPALLTEPSIPKFVLDTGYAVAKFRGDAAKIDIMLYQRPKQNTLLCCFHCEAEIVNNKVQFSLKWTAEDTDGDTLNAICKVMTQYYIVVQFLMKNAPQKIIRTEKVSYIAPKSGSSKKHKKPIRNKVHIHTVPQLTAEEIRLITQSREIVYTCEAWSVRGHYRHYKTGKVAYVKPYIKGKQKDKFQPKDYIIHKEEA